MGKLKYAKTLRLLVALASVQLVSLVPAPHAHKPILLVATWVRLPVL